MRLRRLQSLGSVSLALAAATLCASYPSPAQAAGLVGAFAPKNWTLNRYFVDGDSDGGYTLQLVDSLPGTSPGRPSDSIPYSYGCGTFVTPGDLGPFACVDFFGSVGQNFKVTGTSTDLPPDIYNSISSASQDLNAQGARTLVEWSLVYSGPDVWTTLGFRFNTTDSTNAILGYFYSGDSSYQFSPGNLAPLQLKSSSSTGALPAGVLVSDGDVLRFGVYTDGTTGALGDVSITGFDAQPVPAPLPLLGAGAAFGWSRRLRRRVRSRVAMASR